MVLRRILESPITFGVVLLAALGLIFYVLLGREAGDTLIDQAMHREQVVTKAGAASIGSFLDLASRSLSVVGGGGVAEGKLATFVDSWRGTPIVGTAFVDETGIVRQTINQNGSKGGVGSSVADRDYFAKAKESSQSGVIIGKAVVSRVGASLGRFVVPLVVPLRDGEGKFRGLIITSAVLDELTKQYLNPLKISDQTGVHLITTDGTILYSSIGPKAGENLLDYIRKHEFLGSEILAKKVEEGLKKGEEGTLDLAWPDNPSQPWTWKRHLVAYSPIKIEEGRWWYVVLTTPVDDALKFATPLYIRILVTFAAVFLALLAYSIRLAKHVAFQEAKKYEHLKHGIKE